MFHQHLKLAMPNKTLIVQPYQKFFLLQDFCTFSNQLKILLLQYVWRYTA